METGVIFDSFNPYESLEPVTARSPEELSAALKAIRTPIKIISIVAMNGRYTAFVIGDLKTTKSKKIKKEI